jgi:predicted TIM-barrel enzyme
LKLKGAHQLFVNADDDNIQEGSVHTIKKNTEAVVVACKATGREVNADKIKYIQISKSECRTKSECKD